MASGFRPLWIWAAHQSVVDCSCPHVGCLGGWGGYANNEDAGAKCSEATLYGRYLFDFNGFELKNNDKVVPFAQAGYEVYDGNGHVKGVSSANFDGEITRNEHYSGTYTVEADCTGTVRYTDGTCYDLFINPDGSMFTFVQTHPKGFVASGTAKRG